MIPAIVSYIVLFCCVAWILRDAWNEITFRYYQLPKLRYSQALGILVVLKFAGGGFPGL